MLTQTPSSTCPHIPPQDELSTLIHKVKDVVTENEFLAERVKHGGGGSSDCGASSSHTTTKFTSGPNILFESRISELEAQLAQLSIDLKRVTDENEELKRKRAFNNEIDSSCIEAYKKQVENLQRDKAIGEDSLKKLQKQIADLKERDAQVYVKSERSREIVEQTNFEKTQADIEIRRLKVGLGARQASVQLNV